MAEEINNLKEKNKMQLKKNIVLKGIIELKTGLHIGGSKEKLEIGGVDSPVIRNPYTNEPYIPGSTFKGKLRSVLEFALDKISPDGKPYSSKNVNDEICLIFGDADKDVKRGPTRLIVRDAYPTESTIEMWKELDSELLYTELKTENTINRITSEANPRSLERVVAGSKFHFEMVYSVFTDIDENNFNIILQGLKLLEHSGIGGNISRGYGQIKIHLKKPFHVLVDDYKNNTQNYKDSLSVLYSDKEQTDLTTLDEITT